MRLQLTPGIISQTKNYYTTINIQKISPIPKFSLQIQHIVEPHELKSQAHF